jgi:NDP-sugar pyrophosphorylase family protein
VIGPGCVVEEGAVVRGSVLWEGVHVGRRARVRDSVVADTMRVAAGARLERRLVVPGPGGRGQRLVEVGE